MFLVNEARQLLSLSAPPEKLMWCGWPAEKKVRDFASAQDGRVCVVLLDKERGRKTDENLCCVNAEGVVLWRAEPPEPASGDSFVSMRVDGDQVHANSWSGFLMTYDVRSGAELRRQFVK